MDKIEYNRRRLFNLARKYADSIKCPKCNNDGKNLKVVFLSEFGDPNLPSRVVIFCKKCGKYNETFAQAPDAQARAYAEEEMRLKRLETRKATAEEADKLIK